MTIPLMFEYKMIQKRVFKEGKSFLLRYFQNHSNQAERVRRAKRRMNILLSAFLYHISFLYQ